MKHEKGVFQDASGDSRVTPPEMRPQIPKGPQNSLDPLNTP